jgi:hypothetical protein
MPPKEIRLKKIMKANNARFILEALVLLFLNKAKTSLFFHK